MEYGRFGKICLRPISRAFRVLKVYYVPGFVICSHCNQFDVCICVVGGFGCVRCCGGGCFGIFCSFREKYGCCAVFVAIAVLVLHAVP